MTKESLAALLTGREYHNEITKQEEQEAKEAGLVVVFGYSDDNMEMRGAIHEEFGAYEGGEIAFTKEGKEIEAEDMEVLEKYNVVPPLNKIEAVWCPENNEGDIMCSWLYETEIPHSEFDIMEDGELYCQGIVFSINDLK